jgi:hypothetical protein
MHVAMLRARLASLLDLTLPSVLLLLPLSLPPSTSGTTTVSSAVRFFFCFTPADAAA